MSGVMDGLPERTPAMMRLVSDLWDGVEHGVPAAPDLEERVRVMTRVAPAERSYLIQLLASTRQRRL